MTRWSRAGLLVEQQVIIFGFTVICPLVDSHVYEAARECRVVAEVAANWEEAICRLGVYIVIIDGWNV